MSLGVEDFYEVITSPPWLWDLLTAYFLEKYEHDFVHTFMDYVSVIIHISP